MKKIIVIFFSVLLVSCTDNKEVAIPENILTEKKMADVMTDMQVLEAAINLNITDDITAGKIPDLKASTLALLEKNNVTEKQYNESFDFYTQHPHLLIEVYKIILNNLSERQAKAVNEKEPVLKKTDTVKKP